ncbi:MAG: hypothetical protein AAFR81_27990 [Chloroflexota bacterium]
MDELPKITKDIFIRTAVTRSLKTLIWHFDFKKNVNGKSYIGVPAPTTLIEIVEEMIEVNDLGFTQVVLSDLQNMVLYMNDFTARAFATGKGQAKLLWIEGNKTQIDQYINYKPDDFQLIAYDLASTQVGEVEFGWFVEGFCRQWASEWVHHITVSSDE